MTNAVRNYMNRWSRVRFPVPRKRDGSVVEQRNNVSPHLSLSSRIPQALPFATNADRDYIPTKDEVAGSSPAGSIFDGAVAQR